MLLSRRVSMTNTTLIITFLWQAAITSPSSIMITVDIWRSCKLWSTAKKLHIQRLHQPETQPCYQVRLGDEFDISTGSNWCNARLHIQRLAWSCKQLTRTFTCCCQKEKHNRHVTFPMFNDLCCSREETTWLIDLQFVWLVHLLDVECVFMSDIILMTCVLHNVCQAVSNDHSLCALIMVALLLGWGRWYDVLRL